MTCPSPMTSTLGIIGGRYRRRKIHFQLSRSDQQATYSLLRPSGSRVRETLFNWLAYDLTQAKVLDLFAGSGILGFESLSRGASEAWFVEKQSFYAKQIEQNSVRLQCQCRIQVIRDDALLWLERYADKLSEFSIIFVDPPFFFHYQSILDLLSVSVDKSCLVYIECDKKQMLFADECSIGRQGWVVVKQTVVGNVRSLLLSRTGSCVPHR